MNKWRSLFLTAWLLFAATSLGINATPTSAQTSGTLKIDFSRVQVNQQKQNLFNANLNNIFATLESKIPELGTSGVKSAKMLYPADMKKESPSDSPSLTVYGSFDFETGELLINSDAFGRMAEANSTIAHEILHSFTPGSNGYNLADPKQKGDVFEEMLVEYFTQKYYPSSPVAYDWLEDSVPTIKKILIAAKQPDPDKILAKAMFSSKLTDLNAIIDPYITTKDFLAGLGQYLGKTPEKTNKAGAQTYLAAVLKKVSAATGVTGEENAASTLNFLPSALTIGVDYNTEKTKVGTTLSADPGATDATFTLSVPTGSKISLGKTSITFKSAGDDYKDGSKDNDNHAFGVTLASGATVGEKITVTATGTLGGKSVSQALTITVGAKGSGVISNGSAGLVLKKVVQIDPKDLPGSKFDPSTLVEALLPKLINGFLILIALAAFFGLIYSGFMFITAGGDTARVATAQKNIAWAITGIIVALLSYGLVQLAANWSTFSFGGSTNGGSNNHSTGVIKVADNKGKDLNQIAVTDPKTTTTSDVFLHLESKPAVPTAVTIGVNGNLPLTLSTNQLVFTPDNWDKDQKLTITYSGNGQLGDDALLTFEVSGETVFDLPYTLPEGDDETGSGDGLIDTNGDGIDDATAPTLVVMTPDSTDAVTNYILGRPDTGIGISLVMLIESDPIEDAELTVKLSVSGDFPLKVEPASTTFNGRNWARGQEFNVTYEGQGKSGQVANINFSIGDEVVHSIQFTIP